MGASVTGRMGRSGIGFDSFAAVTDARVLSVRPGPEGATVVTFDRDLGEQEALDVWWHLTSSSDENLAARLDAHGSLVLLDACLADVDPELEPGAVCIGEALAKVGRLIVGTPPT